jgi:hypothetical protein
VSEVEERPFAFRFNRASDVLAKFHDLWQSVGMGNKNAPKREKKKPKQNKPKRGDFTQPAPRIVKEPAGRE